MYGSLKYGFINKEGIEVIPYHYDEATPFNFKTGFAEVKVRNNTFLIDTAGRRFLLAKNLTELSPRTEALDLRNEKLDSIPDFIFAHSNLKVLFIRILKYEPITISPKIKQLNKLIYLNLENTHIHLTSF